MIYGRKWHEYAKQWDMMVINASRRAEASHAAVYALDNHEIYQAIEKETGVPWQMTAITHRRESDAQDKFGNPLFTSYLGNGQPLTMKTTIVPKGRGPFIKKFEANNPQLINAAFIAGAIDAYHIDRMSEVKDWKLEKILYYSELFNGAGYDVRGLPSPYLWGGTSIQQPGKFIADHKWSSRTMDQQLGCCAILRMIGVDGYPRES